MTPNSNLLGIFFSRSKVRLLRKSMVKEKVKATKTRKERNAPDSKEALANFHATSLDIRFFCYIYHHRDDDSTKIEN